MTSAQDPSQPASPSASGAWRRILPWLALAAVLISTAFFLDDRVIAWVAAHQVKAVKNAAGIISQVGDWPPICGLAIVLLGIAWKKRNRRWTQILAIMLASAMLAGVFANSLRAVCGRTRPNAKVPAGWYGFMHGDHTNQYHSFPSGHSAVIMAFCLPLIIYSPRLRIPGLLAIGLVAGSRIYLNVHHLSDVTSSLFIGAGCFAIVREIAARKFGAPQPAVLDAPTAGVERNAEPAQTLK
jgi:membrane-associated phospholipid phosphatase